jgi:hypothetical protein
MGLMKRILSQTGAAGSEGLLKRAMALRGAAQEEVGESVEADGLPSQSAGPELEDAEKKKPLRRSSKRAA